MDAAEPIRLSAWALAESWTLNSTRIPDTIGYSAYGVSVEKLTQFIQQPLSVLALLMPSRQFEVQLTLEVAQAELREFRSINMSGSILYTQPM